MTRHEQEQLYLLVGQAFELKGTGYLTDACQAIADWQDRRRLSRLERRQEDLARLVRVLRETDPQRRAT